jgi:hypothetical protein
MQRHPHHNASRVAAGYLERGLGINGALGHTMDVATFAAGRSRAITLLNRWELRDLGYTGPCVCDAESDCVYHHTIASRAARGAKP